MKDSVVSTLEEFNKYRVPEIEATLKDFDEESFAVEFKGSYCGTCGFYDYFDDFKYILEDDFGLKNDVTEILEASDGTLVRFKFKP